MTDILVKLFVKDYKDVEKVSVRTAYGVLASGVGIFCNVLLTIAKMVIGILLHSVSVTADAFNNLSDAGSSIIGMIGVKMAEKPADKEHPFGHGRLEYIAALIVSFLVIEVGFTFFKNAIVKIREPEELKFSLVSILILVLSIGVKLWLAMFNRKLGEKISSQVMMATAADALGDVITTAATILSVVFWRITGINIDGFVGLGVSLVVMWAGFGIAKDTLEPLIGIPATWEDYEKIKHFVEKYAGIEGSHDLVIHNYGPGRSMAIIHAEVPNDVPIDVSHEIIDRIERDASKKFNMMLVIHMDPVERDNKRLAQYRSLISRVLMDIDIRLSFHDFRMVGAGKNVCLVFDLVVPREYKASAVSRLKNRINNEVSRREPGCRCSITAENSFRSEKHVSG